MTASYTTPYQCIRRPALTSSRRGRRTDLLGGRSQPERHFEAEAASHPAGSLDGEGGDEARDRRAARRSSSACGFGSLRAASTRAPPIPSPFALASASSRAHRPKRRRTRSLALEPGEARALAPVEVPGDRRCGALVAHLLEVDAHLTSASKREEPEAFGVGQIEPQAVVDRARHFERRLAERRVSEPSLRAGMIDRLRRGSEATPRAAMNLLR